MPKSFHCSSAHLATLPAASLVARLRLPVRPGGHSGDHRRKNLLLLNRRGIYTSLHFIRLSLDTCLFIHSQPLVHGLCRHGPFREFLVLCQLCGIYYDLQFIKNLHLAFAPNYVQIRFLSCRRCGMHSFVWAPIICDPPT